MANPDVRRSFDQASERTRMLRVRVRVRVRVLIQPAAVQRHMRCDFGGEVEMGMARAQKSRKNDSLGSKLVSASPAGRGADELGGRVQLHGLEALGVVRADGGADDEEEGVGRRADAERLLRADEGRAWG